MARAACTGPSLIYTSFSSTREETCSTSSPSICAGLSGAQSSRVRASTLGTRLVRKGIPQLLGASGLRSAASWEGRLHLGPFLNAKGASSVVLGSRLAVMTTDIVYNNQLLNAAVRSNRFQSSRGRE